MKTIMLLNGHISDYEITRKLMGTYDNVICCDGGLRHAKALEAFPDYILGDFDSVSPELLENYEKKGVCTVGLPREKDFTDSEFAIGFALEKGTTEMLIFGGLGNRADHSLANIHILKKAMEKGVKAEIVNEKNRISLADKDVMLEGELGEALSLIPLTQEVTGVTTSGLKYALDNGTLKIGESLGISNEFTANKVIIKIKTGILILIRAMD